MAQKVQVLLIDDLDGGEADETVTFGLDGKVYEIDLKAKSAEKLRKLLAPYIDKGRKTKQGTPAVRGRGTARSNGGSEDTARIREWAKQNGYEVNDRGRVPATIREAYEKANG
ncbi:Lsr2 family protein [Streptomyces sp. SID8381]|uniref:histone-like nucleoid-structuring protein Lsr2 n=1 Tax=unclassified Streptomyces TaxID=2593676 RepID=UPI00036894AE|nr:MULTISPECIES: Lsr2 family protein [unclassified Streptomyces]MYX26065.1 Lsr2 family protein [Streptomyces sp. SID8381]